MAKKFSITVLVTVLLFLTPVIMSQTVFYHSAYAAEYDDAETIMKVQQALNDAGYDCGTADGVAGSKTQSAIEQFQQDKGLDVTGSINDNLLLALGLSNNSTSEDSLNETSQKGVPVETFVDRYNYAVDYYNALPDSSDEDVSNITVDRIENTVSFRPDKRFTISLNSKSDSKNNISSFNANMDEDDLISDGITAAEATALIYALDTSLDDFSDALNLYDLILDSPSTEYHNIVYTVSTNNGFNITGTLNEFVVAGEEGDNNVSEFNNNFGSSEKELATAIVGNLETIINNAGKVLDCGDPATAMYMTYNNSVSIAVTFDLTENSYLIVTFPDPDKFTESDSSDYVDFLTYLVQASDEELSESQAYNVLNNTIPYDNEVYSLHDNNYIYASPMFAIQIMM